MVLRVALCGTQFASCEGVLKKEIERRGIDDIVVETVPDEKLKEEISKRRFDVAVPKMMRLTRDILKDSGLKCVHQYGVGVEGIDFECCLEDNIYICNIASDISGNAEATAEQAIHLMLSGCRKVNGCAESVLKMILGSPLASQISTKNIVVIGFGSVGKEVVKRLIGFSPSKITVLNRSTPSSDYMQELQSIGNYFNTCIEAVQTDLNILKAERWSDTKATSALYEANIIILACSLAPATHGLLGDSFFNNLNLQRPLSRELSIVNVARGPLVSGSTILRQLNSGVVDFFASDVGYIPIKEVAESGVFIDDMERSPEPSDSSDAFHNHPNCFFTPHSGGAADVAYNLMAKFMVDNLVSIRDSGKPLTWLNTELK